MAMEELVLIGVTGSSPVVLHVTGELDMATVGDLEAVTLALADYDLVVDMSGVTFMDASGIGALLGALRRSHDTGRWIALRSPTAPVRKVLRLSGADQVLPIQDGDGRPWLAVLNRGGGTSSADLAPSTLTDAGAEGGVLTP
jgi:anti-sigma B factor antagonist